MDFFENTKYQTKPNYIRRKVGGNDILIPVAENVADFNGFIELNPAAAFIWDLLKSPMDIHGISVALAEKFDIDEATAKADSEEFLALLKEHKMLLEV